MTPTVHLFQEFWTLGQQFTPTLLFRQGCGRVLPMFPARPPRPIQPFGGSRSGTGTAVYRFGIAPCDQRLDDTNEGHLFKTQALLASFRNLMKCRRSLLAVGDTEVL